MNAAMAINEASAAGVRIQVDGDDLLLEADAPPPAPIFELLVNCKPHIVRILRFGGTAFGEALGSLQLNRPEFVDQERWQQCIADAKRFLETWGGQANALGWSPTDLFGLHQPPEHPHCTYQRLSRFDHAGLLWLLRGRRVVALTEITAAIQISGGAPLIFRRMFWSTQKRGARDPHCMTHRKKERAPATTKLGVRNDDPNSEIARRGSKLFEKCPFGAR